MMANSPLRILFLQTQAHRSPTAAAQHMLVRNLDQESIEVHVACAVAGGASSSRRGALRATSSGSIEKS
jgi:hypothetical protein